ncbi:MAG: type II toxin-antitoxin system VapC family toxin [Actinobacteria bacterium]|nr:type II toxin-antitoxin system VapC family toxin [Actinomycetota bacterium]
MIVVDASAALDLILISDASGKITKDELVAPPLMWSEATSSLREAVWRRSLSKEAALEGLSRLQGSAIKRLVPKGLYLEAWLVAQELGWAKTYDAEYVALARLQGCRLLTRDARLQRGAGHLVEVIDPNQL